MTYFKTNLTGAVSALAALCLLAMPAPAYADPDAGALEIKNFIGRITVKTGPDFKFDVSEQTAAQDVSYEDTGNALSIDGNIRRPDGRDCKSIHGNFSWGNGLKEKSRTFGGYKNLEDYPSLVITAPDTAVLRLKNSVVFGEAGNLGALDIEDKHCSRFNTGNISGPANISIGGSSNFGFGNAGNLSGTVSGAADVEFENVKAVDVSVGGAASLSLGNTASLKLGASGSSDIETGDVTGTVDIKAGGSSDVDIDDVSGGATLSAGGASDIETGAVNGPLDVRASGSSDIDIGGGQTDFAKISASGSSDVSFDGRAETADLRASGSSDISVDEVRGDASTHTSGSATINID